MKQLLILSLLASLLIADEGKTTVKITEEMPVAYTIDSGKKLKLKEFKIQTIV